MSWNLKGKNATKQLSNRIKTQAKFGKPIALVSVQEDVVKENVMNVLSLNTNVNTNAKANVRANVNEVENIHSVLLMNAMRTVLIGTGLIVFLI